MKRKRNSWKNFSEVLNSASNLVFFALLFQITLGGFAQAQAPRAASSNRPTAAGMVNCWNTLPPSSQNPVHILDRGNIARFVIADPKNCDKLITAVKDSYKDRPLFKQILTIVLGSRQKSKTYSIDPNFSSTERGISLPYSGSIVFSEFQDYPTTPLPRQHAIVYSTRWVARHEDYHDFYKLYKRKNKDECYSNAYITKVLSEYDQSIKKIKAMKPLYDKFAKDPQSLLAEEREKLIAFDRLALQGVTSEIAMFDHFSFLMAQVNLLEGTIENVKQEEQQNPSLIAEEIFAHIYHFFTEKHMENFFPYFYNKNKEMVASFDLDELDLHRDTLQTTEELKNYTYQHLQEEDKLLYQEEVRNTQSLLHRATTFYNNMQTHLDTCIEGNSADEIIEFFSQPGIKSVIDTVGTKNSAAARRTLAIAYYLKNDLHYAYKNFNQAMKKGGHELFNNEELLIFHIVSKQIEQPINNSAANARIRDLLNAEQARNGQQTTHTGRKMHC